MLLATEEAPVHALQEVEIRPSEVKRTSVEHYSSTIVVYLPQSTAKRAAFASVEQFAMQIDITKLQHSILVYYEFLIHSVKLHIKSDNSNESNKFLCFYFYKTT